jgi:hypothetical protein
VVDLSGRVIDSWNELWDALQKPCGLPTRFGRNLDAWNDTLGEGGISEVLDAHPALLIRVWASSGLTDIQHQGHGPGKDVQNGDHGEEEAATASLVHSGVQS